MLSVSVMWDKLHVIYLGDSWMTVRCSFSWVQCTAATYIYIYITSALLYNVGSNILDAITSRRINMHACYKHVTCGNMIYIACLQGKIFQDTDPYTEYSVHCWHFSGDLHSRDVFILISMKNCHSTFNIRYWLVLKCKVKFKTFIMDTNQC